MNENTKLLIRGAMMLRHRSQMSLQFIAETEDIHPGVFERVFDNYLDGIDAAPGDEKLHEINRASDEDFAVLVEHARRDSERYETADAVMKQVLTGSLYHPLVEAPPVVWELLAACKNVVAMHDKWIREAAPADFNDPLTEAIETLRAKIREAEGGAK